MSSSVITQQSTGLATETQSGLVSTGTQSFAGNKTFAGAYSVRTIEQVGVPNLGTHAGYLILAKAYLSGLQEVSEITGTFLLSRGGTGSANRGDTYTVVSRSAYNSEGLIVQVSVAGSRFFTRTVKVIYQGTLYHAIETTATGGEPNNGISFQGVIKNTTPIYVDATYVSNISSFGNYTILENGSLLTPQQPIISGQIGTAVIDPAASQKLPFNEFWVSRGIIYDSVTRRFTVPIAGVYRITMNPFFKTGIGAGRVLIGLNTDTPTVSNHYGHAYRESTQYETGCINSIVSLNVNDYIVFYLASGALYNQANDKFNQFSIELIG